MIRKTFTVSLKTNVDPDVSPALCPAARPPAPELEQSAGRFSASPDRLLYTEPPAPRSAQRAKKQTGEEV